MKRIVYMLLLFCFVSPSFAQKTLLETLKSKIYSTLDQSLERYSDFGPFGSGSFEEKLFSTDVVILDVKKDENENLVVTGEFTYYHNSYADKRTRKYEAIVKQILDDFSVIKIIYQDPANDKWFKLFPYNNF